MCERNRSGPGDASVAVCKPLVARKYRRGPKMRLALLREGLITSSFCEEMQRTEGEFILRSEMQRLANELTLRNKGKGLGIGARFAR